MSQVSDHQTPSQNYLSSSANTLCSMETVDLCDPTVHWDVDTDQREMDSDDVKPWGRLLPLGSAFSVLDLCNVHYVFGRGDECDVTFSDSKGSRSQATSMCLVYSKQHFILTREKTSKGDHTFLEDISSNGTFINGIKVGKQNKQALNNNDEIALATKRNRAYVYLDLNATDDEQFPEEVRSRYTISRMVGRGACGEIRLAFTKGTCEKFAIKVISKRIFSMGSNSISLSSSVMNEVKVLRALNHPCVIEVHEVIDTPDTLFIVLELVEGGDLFERVKSSERLSEPNAKLLFYQLVVSIKYLHEQGITHRDLKLENVLLCSDDENTLIKVTDFGLSKFMDANSLMKTFCGTPNYLAPEILLTAGSGSYTQAVDCWSLGVILFMCLSGYPPFSEEYEDLQLVQQIVKGRYTFPRSSWSDVSKDAIDMIKRFLTVDPKKRLTTEDALDHPWLKDQSMLKIANGLMFPESVNGISRLHPKPKLKRQREESDETLDGDSDDANSSVTTTDIQPPPSKKMNVGSHNSTTTSTISSMEVAQSSCPRPPPSDCSDGEEGDPAKQ